MFNFQTQGLPFFTWSQIFSRWNFNFCFIYCLPYCCCLFPHLLRGSFSNQNIIYIFCYNFTSWGSESLWKSSASAAWLIIGEYLYLCGSLLKVHCILSQVKRNFSLSSSFKGAIKNIFFIFSTTINGCAAAFKVAVEFEMFGTAAVSLAVLALRCQ